MADAPDLETRHKRRIFRMKERSIELAMRALSSSRQGWQRKMKRSDRLRDLWISQWFRLKGIDPHAPAIFDGGPHVG